jgi:hypothetical protein
MRHPNPLRMMRGAYLLNAVAATYQSIALYNDSTGAELLAVWAVIAGSGGAENIILAWSQPGTIGTFQRRGTPVVTGQAPRAGQLWAASLAAQQTEDMYLMGEGQNGFAGYSFGFPIAILQPGWSFVLSNFSQNGNIYPTIIWESIPYEALVKYWPGYEIAAAAAQ